MVVISMNVEVPADGKVTLEMPSMFWDSEVELTIMPANAKATLMDPFGWPLGFAEKYLGAFPDAPEEPLELARS
jgi:hypothetical protein